jgi:uncharacterized RDD family membrane protein YckC
VERSDAEASIEGQPPGEPFYRGRRLGLPETGSGSVASTWRRVAAIFLDWWAAVLIARLLAGDSDPSTQSMLTTAIFAVEIILLTWSTQASFGQRLVGIRVVGLAGSGRLGLGACAVRTLLICLFVPAIIWDDDNRGLHDRAVGSVVVRG